MKKLENFRRRIDPRLVVLVFATTFLACGCRKSERDTAEENAIKHQQKEIGPVVIDRVALSNWLKTSEAIRINTALAFVKNLKTNGLLPGPARDSKGMFRMETKPFDFTPEGGCSQQIHFFTKDNPSQDFYYVIAQASSNSAWQLKRAWHSEKSGKVIQEYSVP